MAGTAFLFPGQGSQFVGMAGEFVEAYSWAGEIFDLADKVTGKPIRRLSLEGPIDDLTKTDVLQPAMTAANLICFKALEERGVRPDFTAGHSLGEYSALAAAGVISFEEAIRLVDLRGRLMQEAADRRPGAMQAIIGLSREEVEAVAELARDRGVVVVANYNSPQQVVISGEGTAVATAVKFVNSKGGKAMPLPVSGAWHSPLMESAAAEFASELEGITFKTPSCRIFFNVTGADESDPIKIKEIMAQQITSPVKWTDLVLGMVEAGADRFIEVGPKKVLAGLVRKTVSKEAGIKMLNVENPAGADSAAEEQAD